MNLVIDSSVFISALRSKEVNSEISKRFFSKLSTGDHSASIPWTVLLEIANVFAQAGELDAIFGNFGGLIDYFKDYELIPIDQEFSERIIPHFDELNLKTADAIIAASAMVQNSVLISWDEQLIKNTRLITQAYSPKEFLKFS